MNTESGLEFIKKGFHVSLGATTSLLESIQDAQKREEVLTQLRLNPTGLAEVWAEKGAITEVEARKFFDSVVSQYGPGGSASAPSTSPATAAAPQADPVLQQQLKDLTAQIAEIRTQITQELGAES